VLDTSTGNAIQVTTDDGDKGSPHMWKDPTLGWVVSAVVGTNYQVYLYPSGTKMVTVTSPNGTALYSPEHFVYQGTSYVYYYVENPGPNGEANNDVYVSSLVVDNVKSLKVSGNQLMSRIEPEVAFPTSGTPIIFFSAKGADGLPSAVWRSAIVGLP
jgi:hypothetical protein